MQACRARRAAFTLVEAMVSTSITVIAGSAVLLGIASSVKSTGDALNQSIAAGMAQQLMDEISGQRYCEDSANPYQYPIGPGAYETGGICRERYNDMGDYNGYLAQPPKDRYGIALGTESGDGGARNSLFSLGPTTFANWQQSVTVYYVSPTDPSQALSTGQTSDCRAVEVRIYYNDPTQGQRLLASLRRVFSYVPNQ